MSTEEFRESVRFRSWRKHTRDLYQQVCTFEAPWPCRTAQLCGYVRKDSQDKRVVQTVLTGTSTSDDEQNFLKLIEVSLPSSHVAEAGSLRYDPETKDIGGCGTAPPYLSMKVVMRIYHEGDVLRARYMPQNPNIVASSSSNGACYIFDKARIKMSAPPNDPPRPMIPYPPYEPDEMCDHETRSRYEVELQHYNTQYDLQEKWDKRRKPPNEDSHLVKLEGGQGEAWGLDWSVLKNGTVAASSNNQVSLWDLAHLKADSAKSSVAPSSVVQTGSGDGGKVHDISWSRSHADILYAATESAGLLSIDLRSRSSSTIVPRTSSNETGFGFASDVLCLDVCPNSGKLLAGGGDGKAYVFDVRAPASPWATIASHQQGTEVSSVRCCPHDANIFATGGEDGNVVISNVSRPEGRRTLFVHTGHTGSIHDLCWSWHDEFAGQIVSVDDSQLMSWKPRNKFYLD